MSGSLRVEVEVGEQPSVTVIEESVSMPAGGTTDQIMTKASDTDYDYAWTASGAGDMLAAENLADLDDAATARTNLGVAVGSDVQAYSAVLDATTASFTSADETKLDAVESGATADQTGAEIKTAYEAEADTNVFDDAAKSKLEGVEGGATGDQSGAEIKALYEAEVDTNAFTDADHLKLDGIEAGAAVNPTNAETKTAYEANADTNVFDDAAKSKLEGVEAGADVTDAASVAAAGGLMDSEVDLDIKSLTLPASTNITAFGASLVGDANAAAARATMGVSIGTGDLVATNNLSELTDTAAARTNLGVSVGTGDLVATNNLSELTDTAAARTNLGVVGEADRLINGNASGHWSASSIWTGDEQVLPNLEGAGDAVRGSSTADTTNDPVFLLHDGEDYVWLPGTTGNRIRIATMGTAAASPAAGFKVTADWALDETGASQRMIKYRNDPFFDVTPSRTVSVNWRDTGGAYQSALTTTAALPADLWTERYGIGVEIVDLDTVRAYWRAGGSGSLDAETETWASWTLLEEVTTTGRSWDTAWEALNTDFASNENFNTFTGGQFFGASVYAPGEGVTTVRPDDATDLTGAGFTAETGEDVTVSRSATGLKTAVVTRPVTVFNGVDDYLQLPAASTPTFTATTGKHTVIVAFRMHGTPTTFERLYSSESATTNGMSIQSASDRRVLVYVGDGVTNKLADIASAIVDGGPVVAAAVVDDGSLYAYSDQTGISGATDFSSVTSITHETPRIGGTAYGVASIPEFEHFDVIDLPGVALTETQLDAIADGLINNTVDRFTQAHSNELVAVRSELDALDAVSPAVSTGTAAPTTTPAAVGDMFIDTTTPGVYVATGTASSTDWTAV